VSFIELYEAQISRNIYIYIYLYIYTLNSQIVITKTNQLVFYREIIIVCCCSCAELTDALSKERFVKVCGAYSNQYDLER
jgi:hypothetical protein